MRILWFSGNASNYSSKRLYNDGGWISSLESEIKKRADITLGVAFHFNESAGFKETQEKVVYYPISPRDKLSAKFYQNFLFHIKDRNDLARYLEIIEDFKPDLIQIFGSETNFGLIAERVKIPIIIHIQGLLSPYWNAYFIPGLSRMNYIFEQTINPKKILLNFLNLKKWEYNSRREQLIFRNTKNFLGRTSWDHNITKLMAPEGRYFYCSEVLRQPFYDETRKWEFENNAEIIFTSTISSPYYKGYDVILKTAEILKKFITFRWKVFGLNVSNPVIEKHTKLRASENNVELSGIVSATGLIDELLNCKLFIHLSYIDNSPNSVCEAQLLGVPVIASNVGGIPSLIQNGETGVLVPANDPYETAGAVLKLLNDKNLTRTISMNARTTAMQRHDKQAIVADLTGAYDVIARKESEVSL